MFLCGCNATSHLSEYAVSMENNLTQPKGVDIYLLLLCCGKFCLPVRESFYKKLPVRRCKWLGTAALDRFNKAHFQLICMCVFVKLKELAKSHQERNARVGTFQN